jgi:hypothetical protein
MTYIYIRLCLKILTLVLFRRWTHRSLLLLGLYCVNYGLYLELEVPGIRHFVNLHLSPAWPL